MKTIKIILAFLSVLSLTTLNVYGFTPVVKLVKPEPSMAYNRGVWDSLKDSLAQATELKYGLPHGICRAEALQESAYNPWAFRVETSFVNDGGRYSRNVEREAEAFVYDTSNHFADVTDNFVNVERIERGESFGLFQIMGENLRILGYKNRFINPTLVEQFDFFGKFYQKLWLTYHSIAICASVYNSGSVRNKNGQYAHNIIRYQRQFRY